MPRLRVTALRSSRAFSSAIAGRLVPILSEFAADGPAVRAVYPSSRHLSPKVRSFIDELLTAWRPEPPWDRP
jgi:DNA-binding transcriptional LysR family regulator